MRFGIIGTGQITLLFLDAARASGAQAYAVLSRDKARAAEYAETNGVPLAFDDMDAFLGDPMIEAVYVASPNSAHFFQARAALQKGKHVLCEKPIVSNLRELTLLRALAREQRLVLLEATRSLFDPRLQIIRESLPRLGPIRRARLEMSKYSSRYDAYQRGEIKNAFDPTLSNAALMDIGVYPLQMMLSLFGAPKAVRALPVMLENGFEGAGAALLKYDGMIGEIAYSKISDNRTESEIQGEKGSLLLDSVSEPRRARILYRGGKEETLFADDEPNNMRYEIAAFQSMVKQGQFDHKYLSISEQALRVMDYIRAQNGVVFPADD